MDKWDAVGGQKINVPNNVPQAQIIQAPVAFYSAPLGAIPSPLAAPSASTPARLALREGLGNRPEERRLKSDWGADNPRLGDIKELGTSIFCPLKNTPP